MPSFKKFLLVALLLASSQIYAAHTPQVNPVPIHEAYVPKFGDVVAPTPIPRAPPAQKAETVPPQTISDAVWVAGYWAWVQEKNDFVWICGVWRRPPPGNVWVPGLWHKSNETYAWVKGFWSPVPQDKLVYISAAPPKSISDNIPAAPSSNHFWASGYWEYKSSAYSWLSGAWQQSDRNWVLAPASYVWRPLGYVFIPLYWDYPIDQRGVAYSCVDPVGIIEPAVIIERLLFFYPDYMCWYWHWWHFHPGWWGDCWCNPPWWHWNGWWGLSWFDQWTLWWWWGHPGFPAPWWLTLELSHLIPPPSDLMLDFFHQWEAPPFIEELQEQQAAQNPPLLPTGPSGTRDVPTPHFPEENRGGGSITLPPLPTLPPGRITVPPQPTAPIPPNNQWPQAEPPPPMQPPPQYYPPTYQPPEYVPPQYVPPRHDDRWPNDNDRRPPPERKPPTYIPPQNTPPSGGGRRPDSKPPNYYPQPGTIPPTKGGSSNYVPPQPNTQPNRGVTPSNPQYQPNQRQGQTPPSGQSNQLKK